MLCPRWHRYSTTTTTTTTITITTTTTTTITLNFSSPNRHQVGKPNMSKVWGLFTDLDFQAITERYGGKVTGSGIRNQLYHEAMKKSGLTGAGNNRRAPDYFIAAAEAAFPYGKKGFETSKNMPAEHGRAYEREDAPSSEEVDELIVTMTAACQVQPRRGGWGGLRVKPMVVGNSLCRQAPLNTASHRLQPTNPPFSLPTFITQEGA